MLPVVVSISDVFVKATEPPQRRNPESRKGAIGGRNVALGV